MTYNVTQPERDGTEGGKSRAVLIGRRLLFLLGPFALLFLLLLFFRFVFPPAEGSSVSPEFIVFTVLMLFYLFSPFGKEIIIPATLLGGGAVIQLVSQIIDVPAGTVIGNFPLWTIITALISLDILLALFVTLNFDLLLKIPLLGRGIRKVMLGADKILRKRRWIENLSSAGLLIFMYIPVTGSGAMTTSIISRILNYPPLKAVGLITFGSIMSCTTVSLGVYSLKNLWEINPAFAVLEAIGIAAVIVIVVLFWNKVTGKIADWQKRRKERNMIKNNKITLETEHLIIHTASDEEMKQFIEAQPAGPIRDAYEEMLNESLAHPDEREWYALWMIELKDKTHAGELCFKGVRADGTVEIGYGITEEQRGRGYASEAVKKTVEWALQQPGVSAVYAETEAYNTASQRVLAKCGFIPAETLGKEGPGFIRTR